MQCKQKIFSWIKNTNVQLIAALGCAYFSKSWITVEWVSFFYTLSMVLKDILMIVLPVLIYFYVAAALTSFKKAAPLLVLGVFLCVIASNALAVMTAYGVGNLALDGLCHKEMIFMTGNRDEIQLLFHFPVKSFIKNEWALICGILTGVLYTLLPESCVSASIKQAMKSFIHAGRDKATIILRKGFIPFLSLYVLGFAMKMIHSGVLDMLVGSYFKVFFLGVILIFCYIFFMYLCATGGQFSKAIQAIKNMLPAWLTGFSTMSSAVAMPLTIMGAEKNLNDSDFAQFVVPTTSNIHMIGDALSISLTALALLMMSGCGLPDLNTYLIFVIYYCLAKFSSAGVPGGGVIVILPVVEKYLGLNSELSSMLATIYILQDSLMTAANVMANGAFAMILHKIFKTKNNCNVVQKNT